MSIYIYKK